MYTSAGWQQIPCYGTFTDAPMSVCFAQRLG